MRVKIKLYQKLLWAPPAINHGGGRIIVPIIDVDFTEKERPYRLWTLYLNENKDNPPQLPIIPKHLHNAFGEDYVHDWNCYGNDKKLKYYSRVSNGNHWLLLEFTQPVSEFYREDEIWKSPNNNNF